RELAARNLEKAHPGAKVKITWYEKNPLFAALKTALPAGKGPDVFYLEPDQIEYITAGYVVSLDDLVNWNNIEPWARKVWTHNGKTWGVPHEAYTVELYYNKDMLKQLGVTLPPNAQFTAIDLASSNECKTCTISATFAINAASEQKQLAAKFLNAMTTPEMGKMWIETVYLQTGINADVKNFSGPHAAYFTELMEWQK